MNKKTLRNTIILSLVAVVLVVTTVFTTLAYLASSAAVTNTFSVGNVGISMFETPVNADGKKEEGATKTSSANHYTIQPGVTYDKDPTIYVNEKSADSYLFVVIRNDIRPIEDSGKGTIRKQMEENGWKFCKNLTATTAAYVYAKNAEDDVYATIVEHSDDRQAFDVFETFSIDPDKDVTTYGAAQVTVRAYAIQSAGFGTETGTMEDVKLAWKGLVETFTDLVDPNPEEFPETANSVA